MKWIILNSYASMYLNTRYLYCCLFLGIFINAQEKEKMSFVEIKNGLHNNWISSETQDNLGFIWIGTQDGLHRYDGYNFEIFRNSAEDKESLDANWIRDIDVDEQNNHWISTYGGGLIKFSPKEMFFFNLTLDD